MKYVLVTGGVVSGSAKGVTALTVDLLLKACGLTPIKIDPYLNTDAGTMPPFEHGGYVGLDLGSYERFLDITAGKIYQLVIAKESEGDYLGKTVQVVPHVTDAIQDWIERVAVIPVDGEEGPANVCVIQLGGTIGDDDIESDPFIKALGQFSYRVGRWNLCWVHFSVVPVLNVVGERKLWGLRGLGLTPDILVCCLGAKALEENVKEKIAQSCHVPLEYIFALYDVSNIRHILLLLEDQKAHLAISKVLNLARDDDKHFVDERHPHIYEVNPEMVERQEKADLSLAAKDEIGKRIEHVDNLRSPTNEQENRSDYRPKKCQPTRRTIPSKPKVKEDFVKTHKKGIFTTKKAMKRNHKNPPYIYLINTIIVLLGLIIYITSVSSDMATRFSSIAGRRSTTYSSSSPRFDAVSSPSSNEGQANSNLTPSPVSNPMRIAVSTRKVHQVFLNFRGAQLRYNFVTHVSDALQRHEIKFFIDKNEPRGNDLSHLFVRIEESSIALAIFSTRYPESSWCMDELVKMKKLADQGKLRVIPIFYKVEAEDVNKPTPDSEFGRNFWRLAVSNGDKIKAWMEALECISEKMGLSLGEKSSESDFVYEIVMELKRVKEAIELEEEEKSFLGKKLKRKVGNFNYLFNYIGVVRLFIHRDVRTK